MIDEQELHLPLARLVDLLVPDGDLHPVLHRRGAAGLQFRHAFHFHEAHAALADDAEGGVIAEVRDVDIGRFGGLDDVDPVLDFDFDSVDGDFSHKLLLLMQM